MTTEKIRKLIEENESMKVELKECINSIHPSVYETVCSFSNRYGGYILLGVHDSGEILGVNPDAVLKIKKNFVSTLNNPKKISPTMMLSLSEIEIDGAIILYVYVPPSSQIELCEGRLFDRNFEGDMDITDSGELAAQLISRKSGEFTERRVFPYATMDDIRLDLVPVVKQLALSRNDKHPWKDMTDMELFRSAGLYETDRMSGKEGFNLAGIMLFGKDEAIQSCTSGYVTDCIMRRENLDRYDDRLIVDTNLIEAYDRIFEFIEKHTHDRFFIIGRQSVSVRSHIARELVSNILVHREYTSSYRARVVIERDRIVTDNWSRPQFEGKINPDDFTPHSKNPILAKFFVNIGRADELGSGVRNLYEYTRIYTGGSEPELIEGDVFKIIVPLDSKVQSGEQSTGTKKQSNTKGWENGKLVDKVQSAIIKCNSCTLNCTLSQKSIIEHILSNPTATQEMIALAIGKSLRSVKMDMSYLQKVDIIDRDGSRRDGVWIVKERCLL